MLEKIMKSMRYTLVVGSVTALSFLGGCGILEGDDCELYNGGKPNIRFTHIPKIGSFEYVDGEVKNADPSSHKVSLYIKVGSTWWMKPYWSRPLSNIDDCGEFSIDYTTGGIDQEANTINAYLVKNGFKPQYHTLPDLADPMVLAMTSARR